MFCRGHAPEGYGINLKARHCQADGCKVQAAFGDVKEGIRRFCVTHKAQGHIDLKGRYCSHPGCKTRASFSMQNRVAVYCSRHRVKGAKRDSSRRCRVPECDKLPLFGYPGQARVACADHKLEGQVNSVSKRCKMPGCTRKHQEDAEGLCDVHKAKLEAELEDETCMVASCPQKARYGDVENGVPVFCNKHKAPFHEELNPPLASARSRVKPVRQLYRWITDSLALQTGQRAVEDWGLPPQQAEEIYGTLEKELGPMDPQASL
mmetsp:Transcript_7099/g.11184  ORF Transcript_7099/g.11184 Transcript_7099/m.11184 type:complete len:263 (-) Transcript_7099:89-877(-)